MLRNNLKKEDSRVVSGESRGTCARAPSVRSVSRQMGRHAFMQMRA